MHYIRKIVQAEFNTVLVVCHKLVSCSIYFRLSFNSQTTLTDFEMKLLFVAALCVDLDHSGVNDNYLIHTRDCLAKVYPVSPHENHHADMAMLILEIFNIFPAIRSDSEKYETFKGQIRKLIIATDLENYFTNRRRLLRLLRENR